MIKLFFAYSHRDEDYRNELEVHLAGLKRQSIISLWHDRRIVAGEEFNGVIGEHLDNADIVLLLISPYFIASDYCYDIEMRRAMQRHDAGQAQVIPVILHPCDWHDLPFGQLLATPKDGKPISNFPNLHDGFLEVTNAIKAAVRRLNVQPAQSTHTSADERASSNAPTPNPRSSNLRVRTSFTDREKDKFLKEAFEYIARFFEASVKEIERRNTGVETDFERIDANHCKAAVYNDGSRIGSCQIWLASGDGWRNGIGYCTGDTGNYNTYNELLSVHDDGYTLFLRAMGISFSRSSDSEQLTHQGGAEYLWSLFMGPLQ